jgi:23S rRNA pseudoU1915 N3-methylase RlmH
MMTVKRFYGVLFLFIFASFSTMAGLTLKKDCPSRKESRFEIMKKEMLTWEKQLEQELASIEVVGRGKTIKEEKRAQQVRRLLFNLDQIQKVLSGNEGANRLQPF